MAKKTGVAAIKEFFQANGGRTVSMDEFRALSSEERDELAKMCMEKLPDDAPPVQA